jgi:hypothetical protein
MIRVIIDRFEGDFAVVELIDKTTAAIPNTVLPGESKEGDVIKIEIDREETKERKAAIDKLMEEVWEK